MTQEELDSLRPGDVLIDKNGREFEFERFYITVDGSYRVAKVNAGPDRPGSIAEKYLLSSFKVKKPIPEMKRLREENKKLRECVEFYAPKEKWGKFISTGGIFEDDQDGDMYYAFNSDLDCGSRARQCLKELGEEK